MLDTSRRRTLVGLPSSEPLPKRSARSSTLDSPSRENGCGPSCQGPACRAVVALRKLGTGPGEDIEVSARRLRRTLLVRWLRVSVVLLAVVLAIWLPLRSRGKNLALHRPVTVETSHPAYGTDPKQLVDGDHEKLGFHTIQAANQHVTIDLQSVRRISRWSSTTVPIAARSAPCRYDSSSARMEELPAGRRAPPAVRAVAGRVARHDGALRASDQPAERVLPPVRGRGLLTERRRSELFPFPELDPAPVE